MESLFGAPIQQYIIAAILVILFILVILYSEGQNKKP
jgi:hypothetical protein